MKKGNKITQLKPRARNGDAEEQHQRSQAVLRLATALEQATLANLDFNTPGFRSGELDAFCPQHARDVQSELYGEKNRQKIREQLAECCDQLSWALIEAIRVDEVEITARVMANSKVEPKDAPLPDAASLQ